MLRWQEEGMDALICDPKEPVFVQTPLSGPEKSLIQRTATFRLDEEGTLEGDVKVEVTGHEAIRERNFFDGLSEANRVETLKEKLQARLSTAEVDSVEFENVLDASKPFSCTYRIKVVGYAQRTGKRLFVQPAFFQWGRAAMFRDSQRVHPIFFDYPWSEKDTVKIELPEGYALDNAEAPQSTTLGKVGEYKAGVGVTTDGRMLVYNRQLVFGKGGNILFQTAAYPALDNHAITLKSVPAGGTR
jgi:hypothetical protein